MNNLFHRKCQERDTFTVQRVHEPTQIELITQGIVKDLAAIGAVVLAVIAIVTWSFV